MCRSKLVCWQKLFSHNEHWKGWKFSKMQNKVRFTRSFMIQSNLLWKAFLCCVYSSHVFEDLNWLKRIFHNICICKVVLLCEFSNAWLDLPTWETFSRNIYKYISVWHSNLKLWLVKLAFVAKAQNSASENSIQGVEIKTGEIWRGSEFDSVQV